MKNKKIIIVLLILLLLVGCKKRHEDNIPIGNPNVEYKSSYDGKYGNAGPLQGNTIVVSIITNDKTYDTKIASRVGDNLITLDNDIVRIDEIKDIIF